MSAGPLSYAELAGSDLVAWFHLGEIRRWRTDVTENILLAAEAAPDEVRLAVAVDDGEAVIGLELAVARAFLDGAPERIAAGADLVASVVRLLAVLDPALDGVADTVFGAMARVVPVLTAAAPAEAGSETGERLAAVLFEPAAPALVPRQPGGLAAGTAVVDGEAAFLLSWGRAPGSFAA